MGSIIDKPTEQKSVNQTQEEGEKLITPSDQERPNMDKVFILPLWTHIFYGVINVLITLYNFYADLKSSLIGTGVIGG